MKRPALFGLLALALSLGWAPAGWCERPRVGVVFELAEMNYRDAFTPGEVDAIEAEAGGALADALEGRLHFVLFEPATDQANRLVVRLGKARDEPGSQGIRPVLFSLTLTGLDVAGGGPAIHWEFRSSDEFFRSPGTVGSLGAEIETRFAQGLEENCDSLVGDLLSRLRIASDALPLPAETSWVLPFTREELGLAEASRFRIHADLEVRFTLKHSKQEAEAVGEILPGHPQVPQAFQRKILAVLVGAGGDDLAQASRIRPTGVYVIRFVPLLSPSIRAASPSALALSGGGASP